MPMTTQFTNNLFQFVGEPFLSKYMGLEGKKTDNQYPSDGYDSAIKDDEACALYRHKNLHIRQEPSGEEFIYGLMTFDVDGTSIKTVHHLLRNSEYVWAIAETPNGVHLHCLSTNWEPENAAHWTDHWRFHYIKLCMHLMGLGIVPDAKYVAASYISTRCYIRRSPKQGAEFAWRIQGPYRMGGTWIKGELPDDYWDEYENIKGNLCLEALGKVKTLVEMQ